MFEAQVALADGRPERAVELLDGVTDYDDNYAVTTPADVSTGLAVALVHTGDLERGAAEAARAIGLQADLPEAWLAIAVAHTSGYTAATELAARTVDPDRLLAALGRVLALPDPAVDVVCEALRQRFGDLAVLRAVAERLSSRLGGSRGDVWAARARRHLTPAAN